MTTRRALVAALAIALAAASGRTQDTEEPAAAPDVLDGAKVFQDRQNILAVRLPPHWKVETEYRPQPALLAVFSGVYSAVAPEQGDVPNGYVTLEAYPEYSRVPLALEGLGLGAGGDGVQAGSVRSGKGWAEACVFSGQTAAWQRLVEKSGTVYVVKLVAARMAYPMLEDVAPRILDTVKVTGQVEGYEPPDGWWSKKVGDVEVYSDGEDKGAVEKSVEPYALGREMITKALKGKPFEGGRGIVRVYDKEPQRFIKDTEPVFGAAPDVSAYDVRSRTIVVRAFRTDSDQFPPAAWQEAAMQYLDQYFGGPAPTWLRVGLTHYALQGGQSRGKPDAPDKKLIGEARVAVASGKRTFADYLGLASLREIPDADAARDELWAWIMFFRNDRKYRKPYETYVETLRASGSPAEARKAFDGIDLEEMQKDFRDWVAKWD